MPIPGYDTVADSSTDAKRQFALTVTSFTLDEHAGDDTAHAAYKNLIESSRSGMPGKRQTSEISSA